MRNEFCVEFENDAEQNIKDLEFCETDTPLDVGEYIVVGTTSHKSNRLRLASSAALQS